MPQSIAAVALVVPDYDEAIAWYTGVLGFELVEDRPLGGGKRWVRVAPRYVPRAIVRVPRGHYRHFRGGKPYRRAHHHGHHGHPSPVRRVVRVNGAGKVKVHKRGKRKHWD